MKKMIFFCFNKFFGSGPFLIHQIWKEGQKMAGAKKVVRIKNQFFHARQPRKGIFEIYSLLGCFFMTSFPKLLMAATIPGLEIFCWKSAWVVFFYMQNWNFGGAPESGRTGLALLLIVLGHLHLNSENYLLYASEGQAHTISDFRAWSFKGI